MSDDPTITHYTDADLERLRQELRADLVRLLGEVGQDIVRGAPWAVTRQGLAAISLSCVLIDRIEAEADRRVGFGS